MKKENDKKGITIAGSLIADVFYKIDTYPKEGFLTNIKKIEIQPGGSGNLIIDLAKLDKDLPINVSAIVGEDKYGDMLMKTLSNYSNINLSNVKKIGESSVTIVMNAQDTKQRTFFFIPAASDKYCNDHIEWENSRSSIFHLEYLLLMSKVDEVDDDYGTHGAKILREAKKRGMETSIDMVSEESSRVVDIVRYALKYTDYCTINELEAEIVTGIDLTSSSEVLPINAQKATEKLKKLGVAKWVVIHSPMCSYGLDCRKNQFIVVPSLKLPPNYIKGSTGAGDAFCSGILYSAWRGETLEASMKLAVACAACSLSEENGSDGLREYKEVLEIEKLYSRS